MKSSNFFSSMTKVFVFVLTPFFLTACPTGSIVGAPSSATPPIASSQNGSAYSDSATTIVLSGTKSNGSALSSSAGFTIVSNPLHGTLSGTPPNVLYTPVSGYTGSDSFSFTVNDGGLSSIVSTFDLTVRNRFTTLESFISQNPTVNNPQADLVLYNGMLYGMTESGGSQSIGAIFRMKSDGSGFTTLYSFLGGIQGGSSPNGSLIVLNGVLYGTTSLGGVFNMGTLFSIHPDGTNFSVLHSFTSYGDGSNPKGSLLALDGVLYGMSGRSQVFKNQIGTVFSLNPDGSNFRSLYVFSGTDGADPTGNLIVSGGILYGMTSDGGVNGSGNIFSINRDGSNFGSFYSFTAGTDGANPNGSLVASVNVLYGMTNSAGDPNCGCGTIFSINRDGTNFLPLHAFQENSDGASPNGSLVLASGFLYGMANTGGDNDDGSIFSLHLDGSEFKSLYSFTDDVDGANPNGSLVVANGLLYGMTTTSGSSQDTVCCVALPVKQIAISVASPQDVVKGIGPITLDPGPEPIKQAPANNGGTIFSISLDGSSFTPVSTVETTGSAPQGSLILVNDVLYGMTFAGGANNEGTIFSMNLDGSNYSTLYSFTNDVDGANPTGSLVVMNGVLYGMTSSGGGIKNSSGTIFSINPDGSNLTSLYVFTGQSDGANPFGSLIAYNGLLYGMTNSGGDNGVGTIFSVTPDGSSLIPIYTFTDDVDGASPSGSLLAVGGVFYGMTNSGGDNGCQCGNIFSVNPDGSNFTPLYLFTENADGAYPMGDLIVFNNVLYGVTTQGGIDDNGSIFSYKLAGTNNFVPLYSFADDLDGFDPQGSLGVANGVLYGMTNAGGLDKVHRGTIFSITPSGANFTTLQNFSQAIGQSPQGSLIVSGSFLYGMTNAGGSVGGGTVFSFGL